MSVETWINLIAVASGMVTLYIMLRRPVEKLESKLDARFDAQEAKLDGRFGAQEAKLDARFGAQDAKLDARFDAQDAKLDARFTRLEEKIDGVRHELVELRLETRETLARHDERITALEAQRPRLVTRG